MEKRDSPPNAMNEGALVHAIAAASELATGLCRSGPVNYVGSLARLLDLVECLVSSRDLDSNRCGECAGRDASICLL
jgi:hypothetical protein